jgi:hypothetical protein
MKASNGEPKSRASAARIQRGLRRQDNDDPIVVDNGDLGIEYGDRQAVTPVGPVVTRSIPAAGVLRLIVECSDRVGVVLSEPFTVNREDVVIELRERTSRREMASLTFSQTALTTITTTLAGGRDLLIADAARNRLAPTGVPFRVTGFRIGGVSTPVPFLGGAGDQFIWSSVKIRLLFV